MSHYLKLIKETTPYAQRMNRLSNRIFGEAVGDVDVKSARILRLLVKKPFYKEDEVVNYYPRPMETFHLISKLRHYGLFRDEHQDFNEEITRLKIARGKVKPAKRQGKQAIFKN